LNHWLGEAVGRAADEDVRCIVVTGAGEKAFCAGGDMLEMSGIEENAAPLPPANQRLNAFGELSNTPLPVIAAINGYCYGGGARLAVGCDIRLAAETATFRLPGAEYGLVVAAAMLPRLVGAAKAKEWIFTARKFDAQEAMEAGLVSSLHAPGDLLPAALEMAESIAGMSPSAVQESKRVIDAASLSEEAERLESEINRRLRGTPEQSQRFRDATRRVTGR
jgi:enoyl-CoA hydratase/carnithine racemase